ncbi:MAG: SGNH/GDSL hydrolase family protein [Clostridium sp.]|nr:SGNH/GDSL hydrolase family protein [Clostridium sp.]
MYLLSIDRSKYNFIEADNECFKYMGRIDFTDKKAPTFIYAGSMMTVKFQGTSVKIAIKNKSLDEENYIGYILDRKICGKVLITKNNKRLVINIMSGLKDQEHELIIFKRQDGCHYFDFYGLVLDKGCNAISPDNYCKNRKIECFGDSIAVGQHCEIDSTRNYKKLRASEECFTNAGFSFPVMLAQFLSAQVNNNAQSGLNLLRGLDKNKGEVTWALEDIFDKLRYNPKLGKCTEWDFSKYIPHVVIMELGHKNLNLNKFINSGMDIRNKCKDKLKEIIKKLRGKYPKALFILITSIMEHDIIIDNIMDEVQKELNDSKVVRYKFLRNGIGPSKDLSILQQSEMAQELTEFISTFGEGVWSDN